VLLVDDDPSGTAALRPMVERGHYAHIAEAYGDVVLRLAGQPRDLSATRTSDG
jgi:hypothetical protein